jgi:hypothetical protein
MKTLIATLALLISHPALAQDACALPNSLKSSVAAAFPGFRAPVVTDNLPEDVQRNLEHEGNGCLGVASADFDGNGTKDYVVGLTALAGAGSAVVVALLHSGKWQLRQLSAWPNGRSSLYVSAEKPGKYVRTEALDGPLEPGELARLTCRNPVAVFGGIESSAVAYCYKSGTWPRVWISD